MELIIALMLICMCSIAHYTRNLHSQPDKQNKQVINSYQAEYLYVLCVYYPSPQIIPFDLKESKHSL